MSCQRGFALLALGYFSQRIKMNPSKHFPFLYLGMMGSGRNGDPQMAGLSCERVGGARVQKGDLRKAVNRRIRKSGLKQLFIDLDLGFGS
jgi:hypothetical protein